MKSETCEREVQIDVPVEDVNRETESVTSGYQRVAKIAGFRPGKAPAGIVRTRYWKDIRSEVLQNILPRYFFKALKKKNYKSVGDPKFENLTFEENKPITCKAKFEILPEFKVGQYKGLEAKETLASVTNKEIDAAIGQLREKIATFETIEGRSAKNGDFVEADLRTIPSENTSKGSSNRRALIELGGKDTPKEFSDNLHGASAGITKEFSVKQNISEPQGSQKTLKYQVVVHSIKKKNLPSIDDELAKSVSKLDTLKQLRSQLKKDLKGMKMQEVKQKTIQELLSKIVDSQSFCVPEVLVEGELNRKLQQTAMELMTQGIDPRTAKINWNKYRDQWREAAKKQVRTQLILEKIADTENIEISEEELDAKLTQIAEHQGETPAALKSRLTEERGLDKLRFTCRQDKVIDLVYRSAKLEVDGK